MKNILLVISFLALVAISAIGIPFKIDAGTINQVGNRYHFVTASRSVASLVARASGARLLCGERSYCITSSDRRHFSPNVPIVFEICESSNILTLPQCESSRLSIELDTARWLASGVLR